MKTKEIQVTDVIEENEELQATEEIEATEEPQAVDVIEATEEPQAVEEIQAVKKSPIKRVRKIIKVVGNVLFGLVLACVALMVFFMIRSRVAGTPPMVFGHYVFIVLSGSMEPSIHTGGVVFVKPVAPEELKVGDVVTFSGFAGSKALTTHRIIEVTQDEENGLTFLTKGDANEDPDPNRTLPTNVIGKATGSAPLLGYLMSFVQTRQGLMTFILVPAGLLIIYEVFSYIRKRGQKDDVKDEKKKA